jgi:hypothetical protein
MAIVTHESKAAALTYAEMDNNFAELDNRTAIKWQNLRAQIDVSGTSIPPPKIAYKGVFQIHAFDANSVQECNALFHIPHDFVVGSDFYPHGHILQMTTNSGTVRWGFDFIWANEFNYGGLVVAPDMKFGSIMTTYVEVILDGTTQDVNLVVETPTPINLPTMGPDAVIMLRIFRDANHPNDTYPDSIGLLFVDAYYQSQGFGTSSR